MTKLKTNFHNRRAVAEIISAMMLMGITVVGASSLTYFVNDTFISGNLGTMSTFDSSSVMLLSYDTRDSFDLLNISTLDNYLNFFLCGVTCSVNQNAIPLAIPGGTEFIVFQIQNNGFDPIYLKDILLNDASHSWDSSTSGIELDASENNSSGKYPTDGTFSLLPVGSDPIIQRDSNQIQGGATVNVLVKLGNDSPDILLNKSIKISLNVGAANRVNFFIESGDAR